MLLRNGLAGGDSVLATSQSGPNLYIGNHLGATGTYAPLVPGRGDARSIAESDAGRSLSSREVSASWRTRAVGDLAADRVAALGRFGTKAALAVNAREIADTDDLGRAADTSPVLRFGPGFGALLLFAAVGLALVRSEERRAAIDLLRLRHAVEPNRGARVFRLQLGWLLATTRDAGLRDGEEPEVLVVRAAAHAEAGAFDAAIRALDGAAASSGRRDLQRQREAYARGRAWRE
ncbi:MAG: hypothetical protein AAGB93_09050 [Planctomycetota bacterium]